MAITMGVQCLKRKITQACGARAARTRRTQQHGVHRHLFVHLCACTAVSRAAMGAPTEKLMAQVACWGEEALLTDTMEAPAHSGHMQAARREGCAGPCQLLSSQSHLRTATYVRPAMVPAASRHA